MVYDLGDKKGVTIESLVPAFWPTYHALKMSIYRHRNKSYGIKRLMRGGKNRRMMVDYDSLPLDIRVRLPKAVSFNPDQFRVEK